MFGKRIKLFTLLGFEVRIDWSWIIIAILVAWSLSVGFFPLHFKGLTSRAYWLMGAAGALGLFFSIVVHEFCHSFVARGYDLPMKGITLFLFGGVAEMGDEPASAKVEFMMAVVGPLFSIAIGAICYGIYVMGVSSGWPRPVNGVIGYLAVINGLLAAFNLLPAFPLDGGRVLRSILWAAKKDLRWATRVSSAIGSGFGFGLMALGVFQLLTGSFISAVWWFLIGLFLRNAAGMSYQQLVIRKALEGEKVSRFMNTKPVTVAPALTIEELVNDYIYKYHYKMFPVLDSGRLVGCITTKEVKDVPRSEWQERHVADVAPDCSPGNTIQPDADATKALTLMSRTGSSRLMVVEDSHLEGVITLKDMLRFLSLKVELSG
jgi:Zn-dependent protease/predicted transcriptional regulator